MKKEGSAISYHDVATTEMSLPMEWTEAVRRLGAPIGQATEQLGRLRHGDGDLDLLEPALGEADRTLGVLSDAEMGTTAGELQRELGFPRPWPHDDAEPPGWGERGAEETIRRRREYAEAQEAGREVSEEEMEAFRQMMGRARRTETPDGRPADRRDGS
jgi:hypothetical protein